MFSLRATSLIVAHGILAAVCLLLPPGYLTSFWGRGGSCAGHCGASAGTCSCNEECIENKNCCHDYEDVCVKCNPCFRSAYNCDEWIKWDPSKYNCENLVSEWGCDCTGCSSCAPKKSNKAYLRLFSKAEYPRARCLDGTSAGYYFREGQTEKFLVYFEGGGWCYDQNCANPSKAGTLNDCWKRSQGRLGSSKSWSNWQDAYLTGVLSSRKSENPVFHDWALAYVPYCDGASFSGNTEVDGLHFRGRAILDALIADLSERGIAHAKQVVISGGSAGASAVFYHVDYIGRRLGLGPERFLGLPDAGFFLDLPDKDGVDCWPGQMRSLFDTVIGYNDLDAGCVAKFKNQPWKCLYPQYFADLIQTPLMVLNSFYDSSELSATLRLHCCPGGCGSASPTCKGRDLELFKELRSQHSRAWAGLAANRRSGVWAISCVTHTMSWNHWTDSSWEVPAKSGNTMAAVVGRWLAGNNSDQKNWLYEDPVAWPGNGPCTHFTLTE